MIELRATNWNHVRGIAPLAAAAQVFSDRNPGVRIEVVPHSAAQFGEGPLDVLTRDFDLVGFDHPLTGIAAQEGLFLPLDDHLPAEVLADRRARARGLSLLASRDLAPQFVSGSQFQRPKCTNS